MQVQKPGRSDRTKSRTTNVVEQEQGARWIPSSDVSVGKSTPTPRLSTLTTQQRNSQGLFYSSGSRHQREVGIYIATKENTVFLCLIAFTLSVCYAHAGSVFGLVCALGVSHRNAWQRMMDRHQTFARPHRAREPRKAYSVSCARALRTSSSSFRVLTAA